MRRFFLFCIAFCFISTAYLFAQRLPEGASIAKKLGLTAGSKAIAQWERVFKNKRKLKRYKIDTLSKKEQEILQRYLVNHAIDSDHPTVAGE